MGPASETRILLNTPSEKLSDRSPGRSETSPCHRKVGIPPNTSSTKTFRWLLMSPESDDFAFDFLAAMFLEAFRASTQRPFRVGLARSHVSATMSCRLQPTLSRDTSSTTRSWPNVREHRRRPAAMVGSLVKCRSPLFNPGGCYKKTLSLGSLQRSDPHAQSMWKSECKNEFSPWRW